jgi:hypothetical protein
MLGRPVKAARQSCQEIATGLSPLATLRTG